MVEAVPSEYGSITPRLIVRDAPAALAFYAKAFGAIERMRMAGPGGKIIHAEIRIGDSILMMNDEIPEMKAFSPQTLGGPGVAIHLYVPDADATIARAVAAGATVTMPAADMFWGDRYGTVVDPFGHHWGIATHLREVSEAEMAASLKAMAPGA